MNTAKAAAFLSISFCLPLHAETVTVATQYPSPLGVYKTMRSLGNTFLAVTSGNVGIGTASPAAKLHVSGGIWGGAPPFSVYTNMFYGHPSSRLAIAAGTAGTAHQDMDLSLYSYNQGLLGALTLCNSSGLSYCSGLPANTLGLFNFSGPTVIWAGNAERIRINTAGNVGIGTTVTSGKLVVIGGSVGIGTDAPNSLHKLEVHQGVAAPVLAIYNTNDTVYGSLGFYNLSAPLSLKGAITVFGPTNATYPNHLKIHNYNSAPMTFFVGPATERMRIASDGNVGIGTTSPSTRLHVYYPSSATDGISLTRDTMSTGKMRISNNGVGDTITFNINGTDRMDVDELGNLTVKGAGTTNWTLGRGFWGPDNWLRLTTTPNGSTYHDLAVDSFWAAGALRFDLAEVTPAKPEDNLELGDAVVIDREKGLRITRSAKAYDTALYGIVSSFEQAAFVIGGFGGPEVVMGNKERIPVALVGRGKAKVSGQNGPIQIGDPLTTSDTAGHLMKCADRAKCAGAIAGKALEPFSGEKGVIQVLITLQ